MAGRGEMTRFPFAFAYHMPPEDWASEFRADARDDPSVP